MHGRARRTTSLALVSPWLKSYTVRKRNVSVAPASIPSIRPFPSGRRRRPIQRQASCCRASVHASCMCTWSKPPMSSQARIQQQRQAAGQRERRLSTSGCSLTKCQLVGTGGHHWPTTVRSPFIKARLRCS
jgi:hypothetical protein